VLKDLHAGGQHRAKVIGRLRYGKRAMLMAVRANQLPFGVRRADLYLPNISICNMPSRARSATVIPEIL